MNKERRRKRSKSNKRKRTVSADKNFDETLLIKMLDERAQTKKKLTISCEELNDLKNCKLRLASLQEEYENDKKVWTNELNAYRSAKLVLQQENQELKERLKELEDKELQGFPNTLTEQQINLAKIKESLYNLEEIVSCRSESSSKMLLRIHKLLAKHAKILLDQPLTANGKTKLTLGIKKISQTASTIENLLVGHQNPAQEYENSADVYKQALEKMKNQTVLLREKLKELESGDGLKRIIEEQDNKIQILSKEKLKLKAQIEHLQNSIQDQREIIEHLKKAARSKRQSNNASPSVSPEKENDYHQTYIEHNEKDLQAEIMSLDSEIQQLQSSLKRALVNQ